MKVNFGNLDLSKTVFTLDLPKNTRSKKKVLFPNTKRMTEVRDRRTRAIVFSYTETHNSSVMNFLHSWFRI